MRGSLLRVAVVLSLTLGLTGSAAPAGAAVTNLAGTTVLKGDTSSRIRVRVPADAVVDLTSTAGADGTMAPAALKTSGGKGHVGFLLLRAGRVDDLSIVAARLPRPLHNGNEVVAAVGHGRPAAGDAEEPTLPTDDNNPASCIRCRVPAGMYDLHLLTAKAATVTITLEGLQGRTVLRPTSLTRVFGWSSTLDPFADGPDSLWEGAAWGMGMGWGERQAGVLLTTSELTIAPQQAPVAAGQMSSCRSVNRSEQCDGTTLIAGAQPRIAKSGAMTRGNVRSVFSNMSFEVIGGGTYQARMSLLWIRTAGQDSWSMEAQPARLQTIAPVTDL